MRLVVALAALAAAPVAGADVIDVPADHSTIQAAIAAAGAYLLADVNGDGVVGINDLLLVLAHWS